MLVSDSCRPRPGPEIGSGPWLVKFRKRRENGNTEPGRRGPRRHGRPCCLSVAKQKSLSKSAISSPAMPRHTQLGADQSEASISRGDGEGWTNEKALGRSGHLLSPQLCVASLPGQGWAGFLPLTPSFVKCCWEFARLVLWKGAVNLTESLYCLFAPLQPFVCSLKWRYYTATQGKLQNWEYFLCFAALSRYDDNLLNGEVQIVDKDL